MITCQDAKQLFDRYFDGELTSSLQAELHAHQLSCSSCQTDLAILEACGDVVHADHREPAMSSSFTDRVMVAYRLQQRPRSYRWARTAMLVGSPMAAAATILLAILLIAPSMKEKPNTAIAGKAERTAGAVQDTTAIITGNKLSAEEKAALDATPEMTTAGFVEALLEPLVQKTRNKVEGTRKSVDQLECLLHLGLTDTNDMLIAQWRSDERVVADDKASVEKPAVDELAPADPPSKDIAPFNQQPTEEVLIDESLETL